jgi:hypothetical protein
VLSLNGEINLESSEAAIIGIGIGPGYGAFNLGWKHNFEAYYLSPYTKVGYSKWYSSSKGDATDSAVLKRIYNESELRGGRFDVDFVASNSIACTINDDVQSATVFNTNHNTTIAALATLIQAHEDVLTASASGRVITVTSVNKDAVTFVITVTGGASQAVDTIATTTTGVAGDQGVFRKDADSNKAALVSNAKFITGAASGGLAILKVNFL